MKPAKKKNQVATINLDENQFMEALKFIHPFLAEYIQNKRKLIASSVHNQALCSGLKKTTGELNATIRISAVD